MSDNEQKSPRTSVIRKKIQRTLQTAQYESLVIHRIDTNSRWGEVGCTNDLQLASLTTSGAIVAGGTILAGVFQALVLTAVKKKKKREAAEQEAAEKKNHG